jgi:hypothetical protein
MHTSGDDSMESWDYGCSTEGPAIDKRTSQLPPASHQTEKRVRSFTRAEVAMIAKAKGPARLTLTDLINRRRQLADGSQLAAHLESRIAELSAINVQDPRADLHLPSTHEIEASSVAEQRAALLSAFKAKGRKLGIKITDKMVAEAAKPGKWNDRTMVTWWKRNDKRVMRPHDRLIRAVLAKDPASIWSRK